MATRPSVHILPTEAEAGAAAARLAREVLATALAERGQARLIVATGASQFTLYDELTRLDLDWGRLTAFHLDEYVGLSADHPASFQGYLADRFVGRLPRPLACMHYVDGLAADPVAECARLGALLAESPVDLCLCGIGENGHLAFNDPPADFETTDAFRVVELDEACRRQQVGEGWFEALDQVPRQALSMTIRQILASRAIVCTVPHTRKAAAVRDTLLGPISPSVPASALRLHAQCHLVLDADAASLLPAEWRP